MNKQILKNKINKVKIIKNKLQKSLEKRLKINIKIKINYLISLKKI